MKHEEVVGERWRVVVNSPPNARATCDADGVCAVTVPAGSFNNARCAWRDCPAGACPSGEYCFVDGVGKVYEETDQRDELRAFCIKSDAR